MKKPAASATRRATMMGALAASALMQRPAHAEVGQIRLSHGFGIHYLPLMVIRHRKLLEKHAGLAGLKPGSAGARPTAAARSTTP